MTDAGKDRSPSPEEARSRQWFGRYKKGSTSGLVRVIATDLRCSLALAEAFMRSLIRAVQEDLAACGKVSITGLGVFRKRPVKPFKRLDFKTGKLVETAPSVRVSFRAAKGLKEAVGRYRRGNLRGPNIKPQERGRDQNETV